jgi:hypothetical protein
LTPISSASNANPAMCPLCHAHVSAIDYSAGP